MAILIITWIIAGILACILWLINMKIRGLFLPSIKEELKDDYPFLLFLIITGYFAFLVAFRHALGGYINLKRNN